MNNNPILCQKDKDLTLQTLSLLTILNNNVVMLEYGGDYNANTQDHVLKLIDYIRLDILKKLVKTT